MFRKGPSNVTGWHNVPGNFSSVLDNKINWTTKLSCKMFIANIGSITELMYIYKAFCAIRLSILRLMTMKW